MASRLWQAGLVGAMDEGIRSNGHARRLLIHLRRRAAPGAKPAMNDEFDADFEAKLAAILEADGVTDDGNISVDLGRLCHDLTADEMIAAILASDKGVMAPWPTTCCRN